MFNAPNLTVELAVGLDKCDQGLLSLRARVTNLGALGVFPGVVVELRTTDAAGTVLGTGTVTAPILPAGSAIVTIDVSSTMTSFWAGVDGAPANGTVAECNETDNVDAVASAYCPAIL